MFARLEREIDAIEDRIVAENLPNEIARRAFRGRDISCDPSRRLCVYVSPKRARPRIARFDIRPVRGECCHTCKTNAQHRTKCEGGALCNRPLDVVDECLRLHTRPLYIPITINAYPFEHDGQHEDESIVWEHPALDEDAHAHALVIERDNAYVLDCNKSHSHRGCLRRLYAETFGDFFGKRGIVFRNLSRDALRFVHHDLCRYAIPYMVTTPVERRRKRDFFAWILALYREDMVAST